MFYQWNRKIGWSVTDPMINSNGGTVWDITIPTDTAWEKANDPSPAGWRVPTFDEIETLFDTDKVRSEWTTENSINGRKFTDKVSGNSIFLPVAGYRCHYDGTLCTVGYYSIYWSGTQYDSTMLLPELLRRLHLLGQHYFCSYGFSVRSVAE